MEKKTKNHQVSCTYFVASEEVLLDATTLVACSQPSCASTGTVSLFVFSKQRLVAAVGAFGAHFNAAYSSNFYGVKCMKCAGIERKRKKMRKEGGRLPCTESLDDKGMIIAFDILFQQSGSVETEGQSSSVSHKKDAEEISFLMKTSPTTNMEAARASQQEKKSPGPSLQPLPIIRTVRNHFKATVTDGTADGQLTFSRQPSTKLLAVRVHNWREDTNKFKMTVEKSIALQPAEVVVANETQVVVEIAEYNQSRKKKKRRPKLLPPLTPRYRRCNIFCKCIVARNKGKAVHVKELQMLDISSASKKVLVFVFVMMEQQENGFTVTANSLHPGVINTNPAPIPEMIRKAWPSTMVSMSSLMKQVKYGDKAAAQAKEEVAINGLHILTKVDELKKKQQLAKETMRRL
ncbi:hypothetical protein Tco_0150367 [Tanacetum coccineum]